MDDKDFFGIKTGTHSFVYAIASFRESVIFEIATVIETVIATVIQLQKCIDFCHCLFIKI